MEMTAAATYAASSSLSKLRWPPLYLSSLPPASLSVAPRAHAIPFSTSTPSLCFESYPVGRHFFTGKKVGIWSPSAPRASATESFPSSDSSERWLLQPVGDGDSRHIGYRVPLPSAFEIASDVVTVGRLPEKADLVIPVATVSGVHARLEKKRGALLITDLDSTNGTFVDDQRLGPGAVATVLPGSCVTFGDTNLAMFRVSKLEDENLSSKPDESENRVETETSADRGTAT